MASSERGIVSWVGVDETASRARTDEAPAGRAGWPNGLMRRAANFRVGHQAFEGLGQAPCQIHQFEI
jgi:hypothetical protein